jgi:hypothetical protein
MPCRKPLLLFPPRPYSEHTIVINAAARTKASTANYGDIMREPCGECGENWLFSRETLN